MIPRKYVHEMTSTIRYEFRNSMREVLHVPYVVNGKKLPMNYAYIYIDGTRIGRNFRDDRIVRRAPRSVFYHDLQYKTDNVMHVSLRIDE